MPVTSRCLAVIALVLFSAFATAHDYQSGSVTIEHPWSRPTPPGTPVGVGYLDITNHGSEVIVLTGATTPRAAQVSIHESLMSDGMMKMQPIKGGLEIPAGKTVNLKPHGYHLMLEQLTGPLVEGERIPLILMFDGADDMDVELAVESLDEMSEGGMKDMKEPMDHSMH